jgi:hypothetical protein
MLRMRKQSLPYRFRGIAKGAKSRGPGRTFGSGRKQGRRKGLLRLEAMLLEG